MENRNSSCLLFFNVFFNFYFFGGVVGRAAGLGLCCCTRAFSSCSEQGLLPKCVGFSLQRLLLLWGRSPGHALKNELSGCGLRALEHGLGVAHRLRSPKAGGIFLHLGSNPCPCFGRQIPNHWTTREVCSCIMKEKFARGGITLCVCVLSCSLMSDSLRPYGL